MFQAADHLHVFTAGDDRMGRLIQGLQTGTAQAVDRRAAGVHRQARHHGHGAGDVQPLLALLLRIAEDYVFDFFRVDAAALHQGFDDRHGQIVAAHVAVHALLLAGAADGSADCGDDDGAFHQRVRGSGFRQ